MSEEENALQKKKSHRERHSGRKAEKKKAKSPHVQELTDKQKNPKAFTFNSAIRAERRFRRKQDIETKRQHIPLIDRTPLEPPPVIVAVVGPPKVGKTTLIQCLIKSFTKQPLTSLKGPVTLVSGKKRRITLIECNNDINSMIDIAKVADLVLLMVDASFGFEMEIFEFLNICQVHGMPRVMGVLTHLDMLKNSKQLKKTKKTLKHRFWSEVYAGAKLFYLSGLLHEEYMRNEVKNLGRFISVMKFRPLTWRTTHPYILADRVEDLTSPELIRQNPKVDRLVSLYGYVRGVALNKMSSVHIPGCGDLKIHDVSHLPDPCPLPDKLKKRTLVEKERLIYAPFSGIGGIVYDKDAVYVELGGSHSFREKDDRPEKALVDSLRNAQETLDVKMARSELQLFSGAPSIVSAEVKENTVIPVNDSGRLRRKVVFADEEEESEDAVAAAEKKLLQVTAEDSEDEVPVKKRKLVDTTRYHGIGNNEDRAVHSKVSSLLSQLEEGVPVAGRSDDDDDDDDNEDDGNEDDDNEDDDNEDDDDDNEDEEEKDDDVGDDSELENEDLEESSVRWKSNLAQKAADAFLERQATTQNLWRLVYGDKPQSEECSDSDGDEDVGGLFRVVKKKQQRQQEQRDLMNSEDCSTFVVKQVRDWMDSGVCDIVRDCFVTGKWKESEDAEDLLRLDDASEDECFGDFEDLETGEKHSEKVSEKGDEVKNMSREELQEKKRKLKEKFDAEYDDKDGGKTYYDELKQEVDHQAQLNKNEFEGLDDGIRIQLEGYRPGMYVRVEVANVPCELIANFDPTYPLILGGLQAGEENIGFIQVRIKKHRWHKKILKTQDPLIISLGWRRFQTLPIYSKLEDNLRNRMLKYTPEHVTCMAHFWGPITPQMTGFLAVQDVSSRQADFRIAATGSVVELDKSTQIMKKLKLTGTPYKIYKKTAFIRDMFNSTLEVAKFEGARLKTVSGIRGQIKKAVTKPEGAFRATFEDKILLSDIVFCRTWYRVEVPKLYNPVTSLLLSPEQKNLWRGMKTVGQLKRERGIRGEVASDSLYTPIERKPKAFHPLVIPRSLQKELPYKEKPKNVAKKTTKAANSGRIAVVREPHERKVASLMKMLKVSFGHKQEQLKQATKERMLSHKKDVEQEQRKKLQRHKELRKQVFRTLSKMSKTQKK